MVKGLPNKHHALTRARCASHNKVSWSWRRYIGGNNDRFSTERGEVLGPRQPVYVSMAGKHTERLCAHWSGDFGFRLSCGCLNVAGMRQVRVRNHFESRENFSEGLTTGFWSIDCSFASKTFRLGIQALAFAIYSRNRLHLPSH